MSFVKAGVPEQERHLAMLLGTLMERLRERLLAEDWGGLRTSHFRVIGHVPREGINVTDLAERLGMTKQGCGQFVSQLVETGHLTTTPDPGDRRARLVRRTPLGEQNVRDVAARNAAIEEEWRTVVGDRRYGTFRRVLEELALRDAGSRLL